MTRSPVLILVAVVATAGFLALAVWGEGGPHAFFSRPVFVALSVVTLGLVVASVFTQGNLSSGEREDRGNRWVLPVFAVVGIAAGYVPAWSDRVGFWTFGGDGMRWAGLALFTLGGVLRIWPVYVLGRRFSGLVAIQPGHELVTTGIYGVIRHPSYLGLILNVLGWALVFRSWIGVLLAVAAVGAVVGRIRAEEALLASQFGEPYAAWRARTARLIPGIW
jgi:protein-S-isoprenylcysteine O-methyltransferase Ste14